VSGQVVGYVRVSSVEQNTARYRYQQHLRGIDPAATRWVGVGSRGRLPRAGIRDRYQHPEFAAYPGTRQRALRDPSRTFRQRDQEKPSAAQRLYPLRNVRVQVQHRDPGQYMRDRVLDRSAQWRHGSVNRSWPGMTEHRLPGVWLVGVGADVGEDGVEASA